MALHTNIENIYMYGCFNTNVQNDLMVRESEFAHRNYICTPQLSCVCNNCMYDSNNCATHTQKTIYYRCTMARFIVFVRSCIFIA